MMKKAEIINILREAFYNMNCDTTCGWYGHEDGAEWCGCNYCNAEYDHWSPSDKYLSELAEKIMEVK